MTKPTKWPLHPGKTQISLGIFCPWRNLGSLATHWVHNEDWSHWSPSCVGFISTLLLNGTCTCAFSRSSNRSPGNFNILAKLGYVQKICSIWEKSTLYWKWILKQPIFSVSTMRKRWVPLFCKITLSRGPHGRLALPNELPSQNQDITYIVIPFTGMKTRKIMKTLLFEAKYSFTKLQDMLCQWWIMCYTVLLCHSVIWVIHLAHWYFLMWLYKMRLPLFMSWLKLC